MPGSGHQGWHYRVELWRTHKSYARMYKSGRLKRPPCIRDATVIIICSKCACSQGEDRGIQCALNRNGFHAWQPECLISLRSRISHLCTFSFINNGASVPINWTSRDQDDRRLRRWREAGFSEEKWDVITESGVKLRIVVIYGSETVHATPRY